MSVTIDLSGKTALITGASQGIGAEMARVFHRAGARVILNHPGLSETGADAERLAATLNLDRAESAFVAAANVADPEAVRDMIQGALKRVDGIDFLINNAGILRDRTVAKMTLEEWQAVIDVNLSGVFYCCKYALEVLREGGAIVNMGSLSAILGIFGQANYASAKAGVQALTRVLSKETARRGIRVNALAPGVIDTPMAATIPEAARAEMLKLIPMARYGAPREVAEAALFLCSPLASYISGQTLEVNGGWRG